MVENIVIVFRDMDNWKRKYYKLFVGIWSKDLYF